MLREPRQPVNEDGNLFRFLCSLGVICEKIELAMYKRIGIVTGGGDAPGLNAVIRAVVKTAVCEFGMQVIGIEDGFEGLLGETRTRELTPADVRGLLPRGGTMLGTRNRGKFSERDSAGVTNEPTDVFQEAMTNLERLEIEGLIVVGGEG